MKISSNQRGSSHIVLLMAVVVLAAIAFAGYRVVKNNDTDSSATLTSTRSTAVPKTLKSKNDVQKASKALDNTAIESNVDPSSLDKELNSLL